jgi:hypothetical protein
MQTRLTVRRKEEIMLLNPKAATFDHLDEPSRDLMLETIAFFETKGKKKAETGPFRSGMV